MRVIENNNPEVENQAPYQEAEKVATKEDTPQTMEGTEKAINKAKRSCTISDKMINLLLTQLRGELSNYTLYNTFAVYYGCNGLTKLKEYWLARANEEKMHHEWIRNYLISCNVIFEYPEVPAVNVNVDDNLTPFKDTVDREIETTGGINNIVNERISQEEIEYEFLNIDFNIYSTGSDVVPGNIPE